MSQLSRSGQFLNTIQSNWQTSNSSSFESESDITDFRAKVDRKLLEKMLDGSDGSVESAQDFFSKASSQSGAIISFPQIWKLQAMNRKDPEIRIIGSLSQVRSARKLIMDVMDPHRNRVVMKIDVSFADHSFIIGKGGKRIKSIMDATQTQIHLPDENLIKSEVKSNIVTITCDSLQKADEARQMIRQSLPLTLAFEVLVFAEKFFLLDHKHPMIEYYQRRYNVVIAFNYNSPQTTEWIDVVVEVRGSRLHFDQLYEAISALNSLLDSFGFGMDSKVITINLEIAPRHHSFVKGVNNCNIRTICNRTAAIVSFPDFEGTDFSSLAPNDSTVTIKGVGIQSAYITWLQLIEFLPVVILFDVKADQIKSELITSLMASQMLSFKICPKVNSDKRTLILKTQERHVNILFEARQQILDIKEEPQIVSMTRSQVLSNWNRRFGQLTAIQSVLSEAMASEPEIMRSSDTQ